ncbi:hypothetical protein POPTR_008G088401v4 [Populus trichocarpa]|uniref:Uncharacterized protein n=1 Tax=Populus trichocarpa TaxID=3694 RepID=A0ACC0SKG3_POPTR|nr:hypothetical protein BDE02_08G078500 [Populus trichocarpa]KAI9389751.1 hypothetical protein POPTR_008G088401v4 [Populus trichocarpa]
MEGPSRCHFYQHNTIIAKGMIPFKAKELWHVGPCVWKQLPRPRTWKGVLVEFVKRKWGLLFI